MIRVFVVLMFLISLLSCSNESKVTKPYSISEGANVVISHAAGTVWEEGDQYLPLPVNVASDGTSTFLVVASAIKKNSSLNVNPIGLINVYNNGIEKRYILAVPVETSKKIFEVRNFDEFATVYSSVKWSIEQYLVNRKGLGQVKVESWDNEQAAVKILISNTNKES